MASLKYAIAVLALVSAVLAQNSAPVARHNPSQSTANSQESGNSSAPAAASPVAASDSAQLEPTQAIQPIYPSAARERNIRGRAIVMISVSKTGDVEFVNVLGGGDPLLRDAAAEAAKRWKFKPFIKNEQPVEAIGSLSFDFGSSSGHVDENPNGSADPWSVKVTVDKSGVFPKSVRVSQSVTQAMILKKVKPRYPKAAKKAHVQGSVVIAGSISTEGTIENVKVISGPTELVDAAVDSVQQWRYKPYIFMGRPVEVDTQFKVDFDLNVQ